MIKRNIDVICFDALEQREILGQFLMISSTWKFRLSYFYRNVLETRLETMFDVTLTCYITRAKYYRP